jgi:G3E family GTPase
MSSDRSQASLNVTLLAGPNRVLRELVLEQLIGRAHADSRRLAVLTFDRERQLVPVDRAVEFQCAETKQIKIAQPGRIMPFRADLFLELSAISRKGIAEEVVIELAGNGELPAARDTLTQTFPGGINLGGVARLTRSIIMLEAAGLPQMFWTTEAAGEPEGLEDCNSESACSRAHGLARSIECADTVVLTDSFTSEPEQLGRVIRLLRAMNPELAVVDTRLLRFDSIPVMGLVGQELQKTLTECVVPRLQARWAILDQDFARMTIEASRPLHPQRFHEFVEGGWRGVLRSRGQVRIASQPATSRHWSQTGRVGVLGSKTSDLSTGWSQTMTFVGDRDACVNACRGFEESLLTNEEMELGSRIWLAFRDPLRD